MNLVFLPVVIVSNIQGASLIEGQMLTEDRGCRGGPKNLWLRGLTLLIIEFYQFC